MSNLLMTIVVSGAFISTYILCRLDKDCKKIFWGMWLFPVILGAFVAIRKYGNIMTGILFGSYVILNVNLFAIAGIINGRSRGQSNQAAIAEESKKEELEKEMMVNFLKESRNDSEYRYIVDRIELQDIDENTIENCDLYRIVVDEETKTVIMTKIGFGQ